jgi:hypothetical protein
VGDSTLYKEGSFLSSLGAITPQGLPTTENIAAVAQDIVGNTKSLAQTAGASPISAAQSTPNELAAPVVTQDTAIADVREVQAVVQGSALSAPISLSPSGNLTGGLNALQ